MDELFLITSWAARPAEICLDCIRVTHPSPVILGPYLTCSFYLASSSRFWCDLKTHQAGLAPPVEGIHEKCCWERSWIGHSTSAVVCVTDSMYSSRWLLLFPVNSICFLWRPVPSFSCAWLLQMLVWRTLSRRTDVIIKTLAASALTFMRLDNFQ